MERHVFAGSKTGITTRLFVGMIMLVGLLVTSLASVQAQPAVIDVVPDRQAAQIEQDFLMGMIPHHRSAIAMAQLALQKATKPELKAFAQKVIDSQSMEIQIMTNYLRDWYGMQPPAGDMMPASVMRGMAMGMMHGKMPTNQTMMQQMQALQAKTGADFDIAFMSAMSEHHAMALMMAVPVIVGGFHGDLYTLAAKLTVDQGAEIEQMRVWLADWYNVPRPWYNANGIRIE